LQVLETLEGKIHRRLLLATLFFSLPAVFGGFLFQFPLLPLVETHQLGIDRLHELSKVVFGTDFRLDYRALHISPYVIECDKVRRIHHRQRQGILAYATGISLCSMITVCGTSPTTFASRFPF